MSEDPTPPDVPADTSDQVEPRRSVQMVALDPTFLRRSVLVILVGILLFQILEWSALRLAGFLFNLLLNLHHFVYFESSGDHAAGTLISVESV